MFRKLAVGALASLGIALVVGAGVNVARWDDARALTNCETSTMSLNTAEQQLLGLINAERLKNGLNPLVASPNLSRAAAWMSEDQSSNGTFSHTDSLGRSPFTRVQHCGYGSSGAGENLARTSSAQSAFNLWMGSDGHRTNMLNSRWTVVGIGQAGSIWTADFGSLNDSNQPWDSGPPPPATATPTRPAVGYTPPATVTSAVPTASPTPTATATVVASPPVPSSQLPSNFPIRRASLQMISVD